MSLQVACPRCQRSVSIAEQMAGQRVKCPHCQQAFLAPGIARATNDDDDWLQLDPPPAAERPAAANPAATLGDSASPSHQPLATPDPDDLFAGLDDFTSQIESPPPARRSGAPIAAPPLAGGSRGAAPKPPERVPPATTGSSAATGSAAQGPLRAAPPEAAAADQVSEYRVRCKICDSIMFVTAAQAGRTIKCSDCLTPIKVPPPPPVRKKPIMDIESAATFQLGQPPSSRRGNPDPFRKSAQQLLDEAEREEQQSTAASHHDVPDVRAWLAGVFGIFRDLSVVTHWIGLSLLAAVPALLVIAIDKPQLYFVVLPFGLLFAAVVVSCGFAILSAVANGEQRVSDWPLLDPPSWIGELAVAVAAAAVVGVPVALITHLLNMGLIGVAATMFAIYALFPFVLLSMMDMNSVLQPFSPEVARSVTKCEEAWGGFYFSSGLLFAALFLIIVVGRTIGAIGVAAAIFAAVGAAFIYFGMIGRLAFAIGQAVNTPRQIVESDSTPGDESH